MMRWARRLLVLSGVFVLAACGGDPLAERDEKAAETEEQRTVETPAPVADAPDEADGAAVAPEMTADASMPADSTDMNAELLALGKAAYREGNCVMCHGAAGGGARFGPDLTDDQRVHYDGSREGLRRVLVEGIAKDEFANRQYPMPMPPVTDLIEDAAKIDALTAYVWSLSNRGGG